MGRKKKEMIVDIPCYFCSYFTSLPIIRKDGKEGQIVTKECDGTMINGDYPICERFIPCQYFWCDSDGNRISLQICMKRIKTPYSGCSIHCRQGAIAREVLSNYESKIFKRVEVEKEPIELIFFKRLEIEDERPLPRIENESRMRRTEVGGSSGRNPKPQARESFRSRLDRLFS